MRSLFYFGLALVLGAAGCKKDQSQPDINMPALTAGSVADVTLTYGETKDVSIDGGAARIDFNTVREGRCATEDCYRCIGGYATITVSFKLKGSTAQNVVFDCLSCQQKSPQSPNTPISAPQKIQGYTISLIELTDYSRINTIPKEKYVIRLSVAK